MFEKFLKDLFRVIAIVTPMLMSLKLMIEKDFKGIGMEIGIFATFLLLGVFLLGMVKGAEITRRENNNKPGSGNDQQPPI